MPQLTARHARRILLSDIPELLATDLEVRQRDLSEASYEHHIVTQIKQHLNDVFIVHERLNLHRRNGTLQVDIALEPRNKTWGWVMIEVKRPRASRVSLRDDLKKLSDYVSGRGFEVDRPTSLGILYFFSSSDDHDDLCAKYKDELHVKAVRIPVARNRVKAA